MLSIELVFLFLESILKRAMEKKRKNRGENQSEGKRDRAQWNAVVSKLGEKKTKEV